MLFLTIFNKTKRHYLYEKNFAEKSKNQTFLGMFALVSATSFLLNSCNFKNDVKENLYSQEHPTAEAVPKIDDENTDSDKRVIYLTFDDGPNQGTENLLKILNKRNVCATAFLVGKHTYGSTKQKNDFELLKQNPWLNLPITALRMRTTSIRISIKIPRQLFMILILLKTA